MNRHYSAALMFLLFFVFQCGDKEKEYTVPQYKNWKKVTPSVLDTPVPGHGSTFRIIYANDTAFASKIVADQAGQKRVVMNDGSIIVKEIYKKREDIGYKIPELFIMEKNSTDPEALNGWEYYVKKPAEKGFEVKTRMCVGCHEAANEKHPYFDGNREEIFRDYLFTRIAK